MAKNRNQKGFTLIELLIVVAIIGIIAAILIPNFLDALQKGRQKRSMGDMRQIATAVAAWYTDNSGAAAAGANGDAIDLSLIQPTGAGGTLATDAADIEAELVPDYVQTLPATDGWGTDLEFYIVFQGQPRINYMGIAALGSDKTAGNRVYGPYDPKAHENDIILIDGTFAMYPAGFATAAGSAP